MALGECEEVFHSAAEVGAESFPCLCSEPHEHRWGEGKRLTPLPHTDKCQMRGLGKKQLGQIKYVNC